MPFSDIFKALNECMLYAVVCRYEVSST